MLSENKKIVLYVGLPILVLYICVFSILFFYGYHGGLSFVMIIQSLSKAINFEFYFANFLLILLSCILLFSRRHIYIFEKFLFYTMLVILTLTILIVNVFFITKNFLAIFNVIFWGFYLFFLWKRRKALKEKKINN
jgi:hypothetical protein